MGTELVLRDREPDLETVTTGQPLSFDGDGAMLRLGLGHIGLVQRPCLTHY